MYELIQAGPQSYYVEAPAKMGIYKRNETDVYLIDSGNDKEAGKRLLKLLNAHGWNLLGIINTHSNADHIGGNRYLQQQTGCKIFAAGIEAAFIQHPLLESSFLYGGFPCADLRHKFLLAQASEVTQVTDPAFPQELKILPLPGHFFDMIGLRTPDDTVFLADCLSSRETLEKYGIPFIYDVQRYLETLEQVEQWKAGLFVPAHAAATADIGPLAAYNREKVLEIADRLWSFCQTPCSCEDILQRSFIEYGLTMNFEQYVLVGSTVRSYLSWLKEQGRIKAIFVENKLLWSACGDRL